MIFTLQMRWHHSEWLTLTWASKVTPRCKPGLSDMNSHVPSIDLQDCSRSSSLPRLQLNLHAPSPPWGTACDWPHCLSPLTTSVCLHTWTHPSKCTMWPPLKHGSRCSPNADGSDIGLFSSGCGLSNPLGSSNYVKLSISETGPPFPPSPSPQLRHHHQ